jgi:hypothetical protein
MFKFAFYVMSYTEDNNRGFNSVRAVMNLGMGTIYLVIGIIVLYVKQFVNMELSPAISIVLGGAMILYGLFRIYRGLAPFFQRNRSSRNR